MSVEQLFINQDLVIDQEPYKHFCEASGLSNDSLSNILEWLENCIHWKRTETDFYSQYEFSVKSVELPAKISFLVSDDFLEQLVKVIEVAFATKLSEHVDVVAHKLIPNDIIGIHNDFIPGKETHRVLIHLNENWTKDCGGYFMVFADQFAESLVKALPPLHGHVCGFEISNKSYHAVSKIHEGTRYSIIYSFYGSSNNS